MLILRMKNPYKVKFALVNPNTNGLSVVSFLLSFPQVKPNMILRNYIFPN